MKTTTAYDSSKEDVEYAKMISNYWNGAKELIASFDKKEKTISCRIKVKVYSANAVENHCRTEEKVIPCEPLQGKDLDEIIPSWYDFTELTQDYGTSREDLELTLDEIKSAQQEYVLVIYVQVQFPDHDKVVGERYVKKVEVRK